METQSETRAALPSFARVYETQRDYVWRSLRRLGIPDRFLEDVAHDVFVVVHRSLHAYDPARPIKPWLFGIAFRVASDFRRKAQNAREHLDDALEPLDGAPTAEQEVAAHEARALLARALDALEPDRRAVFILHDIDGEPVPAIAEALEIPTNTAYSRLRLARSELAVALRRVRGELGAEP